MTANHVTLSGDLTVSGDDLYMTTNTSGAVLVADGTNFNPVVMSGDCTISSTGAMTCTASSGLTSSSVIPYNKIGTPDTTHGINFGAFNNTWTSTTGTNIWTSTGTTTNHFEINSIDRTSGDALKIIVDGSMTTGKAVRVLGGTSGTEEIFNCDDNECKMVREETINVTIPSLAAADDNFPVFVPGQNITLVSAQCFCNLGTCTTEADVTFEVLLNGTTTVNAVTGTVDCEDTTTGDSFTALSGNVDVTAGDLIRLDVTNAVSPETDTYTISIKYKRKGF